MATFYFNGAVDSDWQTLGNWWTDPGHTIAAGSLPSSTDDVIADLSNSSISTVISVNSGSEPTVANLTMNYGTLDISITVTGTATFNSNGYPNGGGNNPTITGNCVFNDGSANNGYGHINGDCTFNGGSYVTPHYLDGGYAINGNATFTNSAYGFDPVRNAVTGTVTFSSATPVSFTVGDLSPHPDPIYWWVSYAEGWVFAAGEPNWTFTGISYNAGTIPGNCTFNDFSYNQGTIDAPCTFNDRSYNTVNWDDPSNRITGNCTFNDSSYNEWSITGNCTFNDSSYNGSASIATITGNCTFNDTSTNYLRVPVYLGFSITDVGVVNGNCTFSLSSAALHIDQALAQIKTSDSITGTIDFKYDKGINGSSILGVV